MLSRGIVNAAQRRAFSTRVLTSAGRNINTTEHNKERRNEYSTEFGFLSTLNLGLETYSRPSPLNKMDPFAGHYNEFFYLAAFIGIFSIVAWGRKSNEDGLRSQVLSTNRFARVNLDAQSARVSQWQA